MQQEQKHVDQIRIERVQNIRHWAAHDFAAWEYQQSEPAQNLAVAAGAANCLVELATGVAAMGDLMAGYDEVNGLTASQVGYVFKSLGALMSSIAMNTWEGLDCVEQLQPH